MRLADVVAAWRVADPKHIHPTREHESETAYWESGRLAALDMIQWIPKDGTVLDFGCGDGRIAIPLQKLGYQVIAVDAAPEMIDRLRANGFNTNGFDSDSFVSDGLNLAEMFDDYPMDTVIARAVFIHHSHTDVIKIVRNLASIIRPGGFLVADWPIGPHHERRDWIDVTTWEYGHRAKVAESAGLELVSEGEPRVRPSVWRKL